MRYPENLKIGDTIGICAPSCGIEPDKYEKLDKAEETLREMGYKVIETASVRQNIKGRSNTAEVRVKEFNYQKKNCKTKRYAWHKKCLSKIKTNKWTKFLLSYIIINRIGREKVYGK